MSALYAAVAFLAIGLMVGYAFGYRCGRLDAHAVSPTRSETSDAE